MALFLVAMAVANQVNIGFQLIQKTGISIKEVFLMMAGAVLGTVVSKTFYEHELQTTSKSYKNKVICS